MKSPWTYCLICLVPGLALLAAGLLVPAHLRALEAVVLQNAGRDTPSLPEQVQTLAAGKRLGAAQLLQQTAQIEKISGAEKTGPPLAGLARQYPDAVFWGDDTPLENQFGGNFKPGDQNLSFADFIIRRENREAALAQLTGSQNATARELLRTRSLTQTAIFSPSSSAAGQAFDATVAMTGLLLAGGHLTPGLSDDILNLAAQANRGGGSAPLEMVLMDFMSLGERLNWDQLTAFVGQIPHAEALHELTDDVRRSGENLPVLFAAVQLSGQPAAVADYLGKFADTGRQDLGASLRYGAGGVRQLVRQQQRFYDSVGERRLTASSPTGGFRYSLAGFYLQQPTLALAAKWMAYLLAGFFLAAALHFVLPAPDPQLQVRGLHWFREFLFSLGFLLVVLILTEPFLAQDFQKENFSLRLFPSTMGGAVPAGTAGLHTIMNQNPLNPIVLLTLLVFFVLQALIYLSCLLKLAEINRQQVPARMKLKLLENEDHLFDAGLYLGFVGTIASLIIASLGLVKFSLMAAYSSTSFGILFVVIFKIFHLRPARRKLLLEAEAQTLAETRAPAAAPASPVLP